MRLPNLLAMAITVSLLILTRSPMHSDKTT